MIKKLNIIFLSICLVFVIAPSTNASGHFIVSPDGSVNTINEMSINTTMRMMLNSSNFNVIELYDPYNLVTKQPFYNSGTDQVELHIKGTDAVKVYYASYRDSAFTDLIRDKYLYPSNYGWTYFTGMGFNCDVFYIGELYDANDNVLVRAKVEVIELVDPACDSESGGGVNNDENGGNGDNGCGCNIFDLPGWDEHMSKLDEIANRIPPAPNWSQVADTFRDSIVPRLINDLDNLLGIAPAAPSPAPHLPPLNDGGINSKNPTMPDVPGLGNAGFNAGKIKNEAPVIQERPDPTGGFDLITNPLESLPDAPENPIPGQTDPGEWGQNKPQELDNPFPFPEDTGDPNIGNPPKPDDDANPPMPGDNVGNAPIPEGDWGAPPKTDNEVPGMKDYKPSPDAPDGSGGDIYP